MKNQWIQRRKNKNVKQIKDLTQSNFFSIEGLCHDLALNELSFWSGEIELKTEDKNLLDCISLLRVGTLHGSLNIKVIYKENDQFMEEMGMLVFDKVEVISTKLINGKIFVLKFKEVT
jgi:hypothetical protein